MFEHISQRQIRGDVADPPRRLEGARQGEASLQVLDCQIRGAYENIDLTQDALCAGHPLLVLDFGRDPQCRSSMPEAGTEVTEPGEGYPRTPFGKGLPGEPVDLVC